MKKYLTQKGFTLIEIMIVLAIIAILVLLIVPNATEILKFANNTGCEAITSSEEALILVDELIGGQEFISQEDKARVCGEN